MKRVYVARRRALNARRYGDNKILNDSDKVELRSRRSCIAINDTVIKRIVGLRNLPTNNSISLPDSAGK